MTNKSAYSSGEQDMRQLLIAVLCGWQNDMEHHKSDSEEYQAYQRMILYLKNYKQEE